MGGIRRSKIPFKNKNYTNRDIISNFCEFCRSISHRRSESDVLKEMVPDETGYRKAVGLWDKNSWIREHYVSLKKMTIVLWLLATWKVMVNEGSIVKADRNSSSGIRYKFGTNINSSISHLLMFEI
ncbi:MAG: hypothetical protein Ct9H90mP7_4210 [Candidatus Neomarinimicrobiota bacterium]|nr:MAG: hypothetical protein Ct9H90mP7_4210 [Candidatus Neomarinimicrobiota bacterium]